MQPDHIDGFDNFNSYNVGKYGGDAIGYPSSNFSTIVVPLDYIRPREGIAVTGAVRNLVIRGNQIRSCDVGISLEGDKTLQPFSLLDVIIENNDLFDWKTAGVLIFNYAPYPPLTVVPPQRVSILNNRGDGDPFYTSLARTNNGKWADTTVDVVVGSKTLFAGYGSFVDAKGVSFVLIAGNNVRNVSQLVTGLDTTLYTLQTMQDNIGYCNPAGLGWQAGNIGIGNLIKPQLGWRYIIEGGNPGSVNYGRVLNTSPLAVEQDSTGTPVLGSTPLTWVEGTVLANLKPDLLTSGPWANYRIWSWRRVTTGTGNALGGDWLPLTTKG